MLWHLVSVCCSSDMEEAPTWTIPVMQPLTTHNTAGGGCCIRAKTTITSCASKLSPPLRTSTTIFDEPNDNTVTVSSANSFLSPPKRTVKRPSGCFTACARGLLALWVRTQPVFLFPRRNSPTIHDNPASSQPPASLSALAGIRRDFQLNPTKANSRSGSSVTAPAFEERANDLVDTSSTFHQSYNHLYPNRQDDHVVCSEVCEGIDDSDSYFPNDQHNNDAVASRSHLFLPSSGSASSSAPSSQTTICREFDARNSTAFDDDDTQSTITSLKSVGRRKQTMSMVSSASSCSTLTTLSAVGSPSGPRESVTSTATAAVVAVTAATAATVVTIGGPKAAVLSSPVSRRPSPPVGQDVDLGSYLSVPGSTSAQEGGEQLLSLGSSGTTNLSFSLLGGPPASQNPFVGSTTGSTSAMQGIASNNTAGIMLTVTTPAGVVTLPHDPLWGRYDTVLWKHQLRVRDGRTGEYVLARMRPRGGCDYDDSGGNTGDTATSYALTAEGTSEMLIAMDRMECRRRWREEFEDGDHSRGSMATWSTPSTHSRIEGAFVKCECNNPLADFGDAVRASGALAGWIGERD